MSAALSQPVPRLPLILVALVIAGTIAFAGIARREHAAQPAPAGKVVALRSLNFADGPDGAVLARDAKTGRLLETIASGQDNFLRITMRTLAQTRIHRGIGPTPPFILTRYADGTVELSDPSTGRLIDLNAFGHTNEADFTPLLPQGGAP